MLHMNNNGHVNTVNNRINSLSVHIDLRVSSYFHNVYYHQLAAVSQNVSLILVKK